MQPFTVINRGSKLKVSYLFFNYLFCLFAAYFTTLFIFNTIWVKRLAEVHTLLEFFDIVILVSTFLVVFLTYGNNNHINQIIALGFLMAGIINLFHIYFYPALRLNPKGYSDLSVWYWLLRQTVEASVLLVTTFKVKVARFNKWLWFFGLTTFSFSLCHIMIFRYQQLPLLMSKKGLTPFGIYLELMIIAMLLITLDRLHDKLEGKHIITYGYLAVAVLLYITLELSSLLIRGPMSFFSAYTHILKIGYCIYLFRAVFLSAVTYPYEQLEETKNELEGVNVKLKDSLTKINRMKDENDRILNALPIGILGLDEKNVANFANIHAGQLLGCGSEVLVGMSGQEIIERFHIPGRSYSYPCEALREANEVHNMVNTFRKADGKEVIISISGLKTDEKTILMLKDAAREQQLENLQIQTQTILNAINSAIIVTDNDYNILMCNKACETIADVTAGEIITMGKEFVNRMFVGGALNRSNLTSPEELNWREVSFVTQKGNRKHILGNASVVYNLVGDEIGRILIASDITELKRQESIIMQQEKLAIIGQMAAGIVHEIKNPLAAIKGFSQITKAKVKDETLSKYQDTISQAVNDINKVVMDFLDFAKPKIGKKDILPINRVVQSMQLIIETQCYSQNINTYFNYCAEDITVLADETKIRQVVLNVCENAIDAMSEREKARLELSTECDTVDKMAIIKIRDNGKGIQPEDIERIGTSFYTTKEKGTGLGMNICFRIINELNGRIEIQSRVGQGSEFIIKLPLKK